MELNIQAGSTLTLTGGSIRWAGAFSLTGPVAMETLSGVFCDKAFIGACGVDVLCGATTIEPDEAAVFRAMAKQAKQVIVVADSSKIGMVSPALICPVTDIDILVTDSGITPEALAAFRSRGVEVIAV
jgi:DeoR family transcriptional regulator of aga operon